MPRFFTEPSAIGGGFVTIVGDDAHHISHSLRMARGEIITVCDGTGREITARLSDFDEKSVRAEIISENVGGGEPPVKITLYQGYPKSDKLEFIIQKAVELGASKIVPFESERCIKRPDAEKSGRRNIRHAKIAEEAAKQCGRALIPAVSLPMTFEDALAEAVAQNDSVLFCYECGGAPITAAISESDGAKSVAVFVGSEGGFSQGEAEAAKNLGARLCTLGERILRCETAPLFALTALACHFEL